jgi:hypothetical protein
MRLVVHAIEALHDRLLDLVDAVGRFTGVVIDAKDRVVVDLRFESLRPAAITTEPGGAIPVQLVHGFSG